VDGLVLVRRRGARQRLCAPGMKARGSGERSRRTWWSTPPDGLAGRRKWVDGSPRASAGGGERVNDRRGLLHAAVPPARRLQREWKVMIMLHSRPAEKRWERGGESREAVD